VNHVGLLVQDAGCAAAGFRALGLDVEKTERIGDELDVAFLPCDDTYVELLVPLGKDGPLAAELKAHGPVIQHVAFEVEDLDEALAELAGEDIGTLGEAPRQGAGGMRIAFLDPSRFGGVLVEICARDHAVSED
jgi:methylmalonyl-CoA/ethylmalonyl-CoA epimerase